MIINTRIRTIESNFSDDILLNFCSPREKTFRLRKFHHPPHCRYIVSSDTKVVTPFTRPGL